MTLKFLIEGNPDNPEGNPIPYTRMLAQSWRPDSGRYVNWMHYVRKAFYKSNRIFDTEMAIDDSYVQNPEASRAIKPISSLDIKPLNLKTTTAKVSMQIYWASGGHGDSDNVFKGIIDGIFENDKCVNAGFFESRMAEDKKGRVEVEIELTPMKK